jgi:hypothetical protein
MARPADWISTRRASTIQTGPTRKVKQGQELFRVDRKTCGAVGNDRSQSSIEIRPYRWKRTWIQGVDPGHSGGPMPLSRKPLPGRSKPSVPGASRPLPQKDMRCPFARDGLHDFIGQRAQVDVVQEVLPGAEQYRPEGEMQVVDQAGAQVLPNRGDPAAEADVAIAGCSFRLLQGGVNALGEEAKLRTSLHPERCPWVMPARRRVCDAAARRPTCRPVTTLAPDRTCCAQESDTGLG